MVRRTFCVNGDDITRTVVFQKTVPNDIKKTPETTALKVFVVILFSLCFAIVLAAHVLYNQHIGEVTIIEVLS